MSYLLYYIALYITSCPRVRDNVDLPWYTSLWRLKECHLLLFRCCLLFVVLNDLMIFICCRHGFSDEPLLRLFAVALRVTPATCPWTLHASGTHVYCMSTRKTTQKYKLKLMHSLWRRGYGVGPTQKYKLGFNPLSCLICLSGKMADLALWLVRSPVNQDLCEWSMALTLVNDLLP